MNKTEFLKMALEKLTAASNYIDTLGGVSKSYRMDIERLKAALANEALERKAENARELGLDYEPLEAKDEPFEYWNAVEGWVKIDEVRDHFDSVGCGTIYKNSGEDRVPLYTTPPQRKPLTDEQAMDAYCETPPFGTYKEAFIAGIRFIEAAHGIKGEAK